MKRLTFMLITLVLMASCSGNSSDNDGKPAEIDIYALLKAETPSDRDIAEAILSSEKSQTKLSPQAPERPQDYNNFKITWIDQYVYADQAAFDYNAPESGAVAHGYIPVGGEFGVIQYTYTYYEDLVDDPFDNAPSGLLGGQPLLVGTIFFYFVYDVTLAEFVPFDPEYLILPDFGLTLGGITGVVINAIVAAHFPTEDAGRIPYATVFAQLSGLPETVYASRADINGDFSFNIPTGEYTLAGHAPGFLSTEVAGVLVEDSSSTSTIIELLPEPDEFTNTCSLSGVVTSRDGGFVGGAFVSLYNNDPASPYYGQSVIGIAASLSSNFGNYSLYTIPTGEYTLLAVKGSKSGEIDITIESGGTCELTVDVEIYDYRPVCEGITAVTKSDTVEINDGDQVDPGDLIHFTAHATDNLDDPIDVLFYDFHSFQSVAGVKGAPGCGSYTLPGEHLRNDALWAAPDSGECLIEAEVCDGGLCCIADFQISVEDEINPDPIVTTFKLTSNTFPKDVVVGDFDKDGWIDFAVANRNTISSTAKFMSVVLFFNKMQINTFDGFSYSESVTDIGYISGGELFGIDAAYLNNDTILDIGVANVALYSDGNQYTYFTGGINNGIYDLFPLDTVAIANDSVVPDVSVGTSSSIERLLFPGSTIKQLTRGLKHLQYSRLFENISEDKKVYTVFASSYPASDTAKGRHAFLFLTDAMNTTNYDTTLDGVYDLEELIDWPKRPNTFAQVYNPGNDLWIKHGLNRVLLSDLTPNDTINLDSILVSNPGGWSHEPNKTLQEYAKGSIDIWTPVVSEVNGNITVKYTWTQSLPETLGINEVIHHKVNDDKYALVSVNGGFAYREDISQGFIDVSYETGNLGCGDPVMAQWCHGDAISFFKENSGTWELDYEIKLCIDPTAVESADFDNDGFDDLAVSCTDLVDNTKTNNGHVYILWNESTDIDAAEFSKADMTVLEVERSPVSMDTADFDKDGKPDLVVTNAASNSISILTNIKRPAIP